MLKRWAVRSGCRESWRPRGSLQPAHLEGDPTVCLATGELKAFGWGGAFTALPFGGGRGSSCRQALWVLVITFVHPWSRQESKTVRDTEKACDQGPGLAHGPAHESQVGRVASSGVVSLSCKAAGGWE